MQRLTQHAEVRMQQRGITVLTLQSLLDYGSEAHDHRGATIVYFDKPSRRGCLRGLGCAGLRRDGEAAQRVCGRRRVDGAVVTVGHRDRRIPRR